MSSKYVPPHKRQEQSASTQSESTVSAAVEPSTAAVSNTNTNNNTNTNVNSGSGWTPKASFPPSNQGFRSAAGFPSSAAQVAQREEAEIRSMFSSSINSGINFDKYDEIPVSTKGNSPPQPVTSFYEEGLFHPSLVKIFKLASYDRPTPIQKWAFAIVKAKRDLMACAQTGSGKTAAFLIPIVSGILSLGSSMRASSTVSKPSAPSATAAYMMPRRSMAKPLSLILAPTRELVQQIHTEARKFTFQTGLASCAVYGGEDPGQQLRNLERGCDILVATPGRLTDMMERGRVALDAVQWLVLDEADRMLDMGFAPQIHHIISNSGIPPAGTRQTLMFSATFPKEIQDLARSFLHDYIYVAVGKVGASSENISQHIERVSDADKPSLLLDILAGEQQRHEGLTLIFTETKRSADALEYFLYQNRIPAVCIHGDKTQQERTRAITQFRKGEVRVLVATSVASRGLDIPNVNHVINYELPGDMDDYVHRIGRTGRAGNLGKATTFFCDSANRGNARDLVRCLEDAKQLVPSWLKALVSGPGITSSFGGAGRSGPKKFGNRGPSFGGQWGSGGSSSNFCGGGSSW